MPAKRPALSLLALALLLAAGLPAAAQNQAQKPTISVSNAIELVRAIGPNRTVVLQKGDYLLSKAYNVRNQYVEWRESETGRELSLKNLEGLTIRGGADSRIVVDSESAYLLDLSSCSKLQFDTVTFARAVADDAEVTGGGIYLDSCQDVELIRCGFDGKNGYTVEIVDCEGIKLTKCRISDAFYGALYVSGSTQVTVEGSTIRQNDGTPLISVEESSQVTFRTCLFTDNQGGTFIDIYSDYVTAEDIGFESCTFKDNSFDWFSSAQNLPTATDCSFSGNSFGEDWASNSIAPAEDQAYYDEGGGASFLSYDFPGTGLTIQYPSDWELQEGDKTARVGIFSPDGQSFLVYSPLDVKFPEGAGAAQAKKAFDSALEAFKALFKTEGGMDADVKPLSAAATDANGLTWCGYAGSVTRAGGGTASIRLRLLASEGYVYALAALAADPAALDEGGDLDTILLSFGAQVF
jgi:hypothetical protein